MKFSPGGSVDLSKEYYGPQKSDWLKNFPDLSWEEYLRYQSSGSFDKGGRVEMKPGGLVEPGVTHYATFSPKDKYSKYIYYSSPETVMVRAPVTREVLGTFSSLKEALTAN